MTEHTNHKKEVHKEHETKSHDTHAHSHKADSHHKTDEHHHKSEAKPAAHAHHEHKEQHHKSEPKQAAPQQSQNTTIVTTVVITLLVIAVLFMGYQLVSGSAPNTGGDSAKTDYKNMGDGTQLVITEWSDFECPFCARALPAVNEIKETYGDAVIIEYKHFPLSFHPNAAKAAEASECARDQGEFWAYHDVLFENQQALDVASLKRHAATVGLDASQFANCLDSGEKAGIVAKDMAEGTAFGVSGTPTFRIAGEKVVGAQPFSAFKPIIDKALAAGGSDYVAPEAKEDPIVELIVIDDPDCAVCDTSQVVTYTQTELFPTVEITRISKNDRAAQTLIEELGLTALPAYIFSDNVVDTANYGQVAQAFIKVGDKYIINPSATGNVKLLEIPDISGRPVKGDANAPVTIIEWSDFECPFCARFYNDAYQDIVDTYVESGEVKIVFMHFPLSFHSNAENAAVASECAFEQGKFWEYHDTLFDNQQSLTASSLKQYAADIGLDTAAFNSCYAARASVADINAQMALGQSVGISGTPGFLINGISLSGAQPFDAFEQLIEAELAN